MNRYDPRTPRTLAGLAAVMLTGATLAVSVFAPASVEHDALHADVNASTVTERCVPAGGGIVTAIDVVAVRAAHVAPVAQTRGSARHDLQG
jgi:hypothetical protein